jgi:DNA-binding XRE family transcriptional regulator
MTTEQKKQIGERLKLVREKLKMNQEDFGKSAGVSFAAISAIETGRRSPGSDILGKITAAFKVDLHWLLTGQAAPSMPNESQGYRVFGRMLSTICRAKKIDVIAAARMAGVAPVLFAMWVRGECLPTRDALQRFGSRIGGQEIITVSFKLYDMVLNYEKHYMEKESLGRELNLIYEGLAQIGPAAKSCPDRVETLRTSEAQQSISA